MYTLPATTCSLCSSPWLPYCCSQQLDRVHEDIGVDEESADRGQSSAMTTRKAVAVVLSSAAVMWILPGMVSDMAMAEAATTPHAESQSDHLQIGVLYGRVSWNCPKLHLNSRPH